MNTYHLSAHDIVMVNCEIYRPSDEVVEELWCRKKETDSIHFHGFTRESISNVDLKRFFSTIYLNYMFVKIQDLMGVSLMGTCHQGDVDEGGKASGVFVTGDSVHNGRRFIIVNRFQIYDTKTCTPTNRHITTTMNIHENPSPWAVACRVDTCTLVENADKME